MQRLSPNFRLIGSSKAIVGESIVWDGQSGSLLWVDIRGKTVMRSDPNRGETRTIAVDELIGAVVPYGQGGALTAQETGLFVVDLATRTRSFLSKPESLRPDQRFNDAVVDPAGRLLVGTMRSRREAIAPDGILYRYADGVWNTLFTGFWTINGLAFSPDGRTLYLSDSYHEIQTIWSCSYDPSTGAVGERHVFANMEAMDGRPDGAAVDSQGGYWIAAVGGGCLYRFTPDGKVDRRVALPVENPTKPAFGGAEFDQLFVTSMSVNLTRPDSDDVAGRLIAVEVGFKGLALPICRG